ncbi:hypothetical protein TRVL_09489 [Trypanosoma vivax]|nr:hypothetical protein TRVL_09489 [Trypanosoma vivax]
MSSPRLMDTFHYLHSPIALFLYCQGTAQDIPLVQYSSCFMVYLFPCLVVLNLALTYRFGLPRSPLRFITEDVPPNKCATMFRVAKVRAVPWLPVLLSACCIYASTVFTTAHSTGTASSEPIYDHKCCKNETMQQFMNMSCTLGKLFGRANVTFSTLKNVGTMALEELSALTGSTAKRPLVSALDLTETVLSDIERCVNSTIPSEIFDAEHKSCNTVCLQVLKERYERCKADAESNKRFLTGVFHAGGRDFAEQLGGLNKKLSSYWNETYKLANVSHHEAVKTHESIQEQFDEEGSCESSPNCEEDSFSKFSVGMRTIYLGCGGSEDEPFKGFNDNITKMIEPVLTSAVKAHEIAAKLKARQAETEAMKKDRECVPLFKQFLSMFRSW